jgi:hypothetical protein
MSAKHEKARAISDLRSLASLKNATLQAGMPAFQSHPPRQFVDDNFKNLTTSTLKPLSHG